jgi:hypothetical protein
MTGVDLDADPSDPHNGMGIIPRAVSTLFQRARALKNERGPTWNYSLKGSFLEIYNEDLIDLLSDDGAGGRREVQIRESKDGSIIWGGLREVSVKSAPEVMKWAPFPSVPPPLPQQTWRLLSFTLSMTLVFRILLI